MLTGEINFINKKSRKKLKILMKYFFLLSEKFYRFIEWEWNTLKNLIRTKRKNYFLRVSFALFSLFSILFLIFSPPIAFGLLLGEGLKFSTFFIWIWILNLKFFWKCIIYFQRLLKLAVLWIPEQLKLIIDCLFNLKIDRHECLSIGYWQTLFLWEKIIEKKEIVS